MSRKPRAPVAMKTQRGLYGAPAVGAVTLKPPLERAPGDTVRALTMPNGSKIVGVGADEPIRGMAKPFILYVIFAEDGHLNGKRYAAGARVFLSSEDYIANACCSYRFDLQIGDYMPCTRVATYSGVLHVAAKDGAPLPQAEWPRKLYCTGCAAHLEACFVVGSVRRL